MLGALWLGIAGCVGAAGDAEEKAAPDSGGTTNPGGRGDPSPPPPPPAPPILSASPLRRLTQAQYRNAVRDVLGVATADVPLPADGRVGSFTTNAGLPPSLLQIDQYAAAAETLAGRAVPMLDSLSGCRVAERGEAACARALVERVGGRAFRRPLAAAEVDRLLGVYRTARGHRAHPQAAALALEAILQAPAFLYLVERGTPAGAGRRALTGHEVAARLSFLLWDSLPDEALTTAAAAGELADPSEVARHARRLLLHERSRAAVARFHREWLGLDRLDTLAKDTQRYPFYDETVRAALAAEVDGFSDFVLRGSDGRFQTLLTLPVSFLPGPLFRIYGLVEPAAHDPRTPVGLPASQRAGVLTLPGVLATHAHPDITSPVHRGLFVFRSLLCRDLPPPPENVDTNPVRADPASGKTRRQLFAQHQTDPQCGSCHRVIDPIGLAFEHYDALGAYRTMDVDERAPVDASAQIASGTDVDGAVTDGLALVRRIAASRDARDCYARQWFRYAVGRPEQETDAATVAGLAQSFAASDGHVPSLLLSIVTADAFRHRLETP